MGDKRSEKKKRLLLWSRLGTLALVGSCISEYVSHRQAFHDQGFKAFRWDDVLVPTFAAVMAIWVSRVAQREETTTLGIGDATAGKPQ
jgi:hypothetical protein